MNLDYKILDIGFASFQACITTHISGCFYFTQVQFRFRGFTFSNLTKFFEILVAEVFF